MERCNLIIAVSGKMRHGKDSIGNYLISKYKFKRVGFADKLKEICMNYDNSTDELRTLWNKKIAEQVLNDVSRYTDVDKLTQEVCPGVWHKLTHEECYGIKSDYARLTLQNYAQGMRKLDSDCWVRCALCKCAKGGKWVITDARYKNEAFAIDSLENAQIWRVVRPITPSTGSTHISEIDLDDYPFEIIIQNDSTLEDLYTKVDHIIKLWLKGTRPFTTGEDIY